MTASRTAPAPCVADRLRVRDPGPVRGGPGPLQDPAAQPAAGRLERGLRATAAAAAARASPRRGAASGPLPRRVPAPGVGRAVRAARLRRLAQARAHVHQRVRPGSRAVDAARPHRQGPASRAGVNASGPPAAIRPSTRRTFTSTAPTGIPNAIAATARAVYGPDARQRLERRDRGRHLAPVLATIACAARCRAQRPPVVAQARPCPHDLGDGRLREARDRRPAGHPARPCLRGALSLRLLGHQLRDQHRVRIRRRPEGELAPGRGVPGEDRLAGRRLGTRSVGGGRGVGATPLRYGRGVEAHRQVADGPVRRPAGVRGRRGGQRVPGVAPSPAAPRARGPRARCRTCRTRGRGSRRRACPPRPRERDRDRAPGSPAGGPPSPGTARSAGSAPCPS